MTLAILLTAKLDIETLRTTMSGFLLTKTVPFISTRLWKQTATDGTDKKVAVNAQFLKFNKWKEKSLGQNSSHRRLKAIH